MARGPDTRGALHCARPAAPQRRQPEHPACDWRRPKYPAELYAKERQLRESGDLGSLSEAEIASLARDFWEWDSAEPEALDRIYKLKVSGFIQAAELLHAQEGLHIDLFSEAMLHMSAIRDFAGQPLTPERLQLSVRAFIDGLATLQQLWSDGDIDSATYKLRSARCVNELRRLSQTPLVENFIT